MHGKDRKSTPNTPMKSFIRRMQLDEGATLLGYLREWRDHMSKMNRCETVDIVSDAALEQIVNSGACSVLEIDSAIIHTQGKGIPVDRLTRMMGVIKLFKQTMGNKTVYLSQYRCYKDLSGLLNKLGWDRPEEWLNMQDSGMNMYKEIVSIDEFDVSVVEECLGGRLEMEEVMRYLKYAEYFQKNCKSKMEEYVMLVEMERKIDEGVVIEEEEMWEGEDCMYGKSNGSTIGGSYTSIMTYSSTIIDMPYMMLPYTLSRGLRLYKKVFVPPAPTLYEIYRMAGQGKYKIKKAKETRTRNQSISPSKVPTVDDLYYLLSLPDTF